MQFTDDTIFFIKGDKHKFQKLVSIVHFFGLISGFKINLPKSVVVGINLSSEKEEGLVREVGCEVGSWPMSYLGLPLDGNLCQLKF